MKRCIWLLAAVALGSPPRQLSFTGELSPPAKLADGRLLSMTVTPRPFQEMEAEGPAQQAFIRMSADGGESWSDPKPAFSYAAGKGVMTQQIYTLIDRKGDIHAFNMRFYHLPKRGSPIPGHSVLLHNVSHDGGKTWSAPSKVDFGHEYTGALNSIIQLKSGRILVALSYASDNFLESVGQTEFRSVSTYSDDGGDTWHVGQDNLRVPIGPQVAHPGAIEPLLMELRDGRVWMIIRTQTLRFYETFSSDGGKSWAEPKASRFMAPDSPGAILRLADGRLVFCWNDIARYPSGVTGHFRQYLFAAISSDDGRTWSESKFVAPLAEPDRPGSRGDYPFLSELKGGQILLYYTRFGLREGASYEHPLNELVRIDVNWLAPSSR